MDDTSFESDPTPFHFDPIDVAVCICCDGTGVVEGLDECPLCDGSGYVTGSNESTVSPCADKFNIVELSGDGFILRNLLSHDECRNVIKQAEKFGLRSCGIRKIRVTDRVMVMGEDVAELLFERARPYLSDIEVWRCGGQKWPKGIPDNAKTGLWTPVGLNPCFRVCKYEARGFFLPHKDGGFRYNDDHLSLKTFMIYLNDDFAGAPTNFFTQSQRTYEPPDASKVIYELRPRRGSCVVFNHGLVHDGGVLHKGVKYILRTEVMYAWCGRECLHSEVLS
jgi:hypothetical protein